MAFLTVRLFSVNGVTLRINYTATSVTLTKVGGVLTLAPTDLARLQPPWSAPTL